MDDIISFLERTMVVERLIGVLTYAVILLIVVYFLKHSKSKTRSFMILNVYLLVLSVMAFFFIPDTSADLYRWLELTINWPKQSLLAFFKETALKSNVPLAYLFIYVCRCTGIDGVLPMASAFVFYFFFFSILKRAYVDFKFTSRQLSLMLLVFMSLGRFIEIISGLRCLMAVAIFARCLYSELVNKKPSLFKTLILYVVELASCLIHPYVLILFLIKSLLTLIKHENSLFTKIINVGVVIAAITAVVTFGSSYLKSAIEKSESYLSGGHYSYIWEYLIAGMMVILIIYNLYYYFKNTRHSFRESLKDRLSVNNLVLFTISFLAIAIILFFQYSIFHRTVTFVSIVFLPIVGLNLTYSASKRFERNVLVFSLFILFVACARGDLCAYKFFLL